MTRTKKQIKHKQKLELLFDIILDKSYQLRKRDPTHFDGKSFWQPIKTILEPLDNYSASKWKTLSKTKTKKIMLLPEYTINGYETKIIDENNHFIIQQVRIPLQDKPTIKKIMQIALNIGQYKGTSQNKNITNITYNNINQFIFKNDIVELSKYLTDDIINAIYKYLSF
jgi:hypothetical protein